MKNLAFQDTLRTHRDRIFSYAFYFLRNREDAEDVTQEVFIKLWRHWDKIDREKTAAWIIRVAHNLCIDFSRQKKRKAGRTVSTVDQDLNNSSTEPDCLKDPELHYEFTEIQSSILSALGRLSERTRSILLLHYFQDLKYQTIGEILDLNINTVKVSVHQGKKHLKKIIIKHFPELIEEM